MDESKILVYLKVDLSNAENYLSLQFEEFSWKITTLMSHPCIVQDLRFGTFKIR